MFVCFAPSTFSIVFPKPFISLRGFYLDFNCLIHSCRSLVSDTSDISMINAVIMKTIDVIKTVNPSKLLYISMDGPGHGPSVKVAVAGPLGTVQVPGI